MRRSAPLPNGGPRVLLAMAGALLLLVLAASSPSAASSSSGPPSVPQDFLVVPRPGFLLLTWKPSVSDGGSAITGYNVWRGTEKGGAKSVLATVSPAGNLSYEDRAIFEGIPYYYQLSAVNADSEGPRTGELSGTALPGVDRPNLLISGIRLTPSNPLPGDLVHIDVTVENRGGGRSPAALLRIQVDGGLLVEKYTTALPAGASILVRGSIVVSSGPHSISAFIDPANLIPEPDEVDNYAIRNFHVAPEALGAESYVVWLAGAVVVLTCAFIVAAGAMMMWRRKGGGRTLWQKAATPAARPRR